MHPYLFFYLIGGVTFIPLTLLLTLLFLWLRLPKLDKSQPRPTDLPSPRVQQATGKAALAARASTTDMRDLAATAEKGGRGYKRPKAAKSLPMATATAATGSKLPSKSDHRLLQNPSISITSGSSVSTGSTTTVAASASGSPGTPKDAITDHRSQGHNEHTTDTEDESDRVDEDEDHDDGDNNKDDGDDDDDDNDNDDDDNDGGDDNNDDDDDEGDDKEEEDNEDKESSDNSLKINETIAAFGQKSIPVRGLDVPMQADPNLNREGYVRMTRVPRLGPAAESISDYMTNMLFQPKNARPKDSYYAVLRYDTLFLYESDQQRDCKFVMQMMLHEVKIFPRNLPDNEMFNKEHPIQIKRKVNAASSTVPTNSQDEFYIFIHTPVIKEDWYFALLHASKLRKPGMRQVRDKAQFDLHAIQNHIRILHSDKHHEHTCWFNSFLGRIFLGVYKTKRIQEIFIAKIKRKTLKLKRPSFLGEIKVRSFNIGHSIPYITRTKLLELATNGELTSEFHLDYRGGVRVEIEVDVGLGLMSVKPVKVTIVLAVLVKALSGMMTLKIKAPPSNRFWLGFQEPPEMDIVIEPIVADKAIKLNMVISAIEAKIREAMVEAIVLPNMDDYPFFDSRGAGGIFEGDEEIPTEPAEGSDAEPTMLGTTGRGRGTTTSTAMKKNAGAKRRGSASSFGSEQASQPAVTITSERKHSWSSSLTESDVDPESPSMTSSPPPSLVGLFSNQQSNMTMNGGNSNSSSNTSTAIHSNGNGHSSTMSAMASKFKRFSQMNFSSKSSALDHTGDTAAKLNTKPTVATTIATVTRVSPSATSLHPNISSSSSSSSSKNGHSGSNRSTHSSKLQSAMPKLSTREEEGSSSDSHHGPRIFASSSPSNGPSKKTSTNSMRRLASLESPSLDGDDNDDDDDDEEDDGGDDDVSDKDEDHDDEGISPTGNDPLYQSLKSSMATQSRKPTQGRAAGRKTEFDTFPKSTSGSRRRDSMPSSGSGDNGGIKQRKGEKMFKDDLSVGRGVILNPSSSHVGIAGILESPNHVRPGGGSISHVKGNLSNLYNLDKSRSKNLVQDDADDTEKPAATNDRTKGNGEIRHLNSHASDHGRVNGKDSDRRFNGDNLLNLKQKGDMFLRKITNRSNEDVHEGVRGAEGGRHGDSASISSSRSLLRRFSVRSTTGVDSTGPAEAGDSREEGEEPGGAGPRSSADTTGSQPGSSASSTMSKSAYLQKKSQAALGSAKAWVKRSIEDRRVSEDDPLLSKMRMD